MSIFEKLCELKKSMLADFEKLQKLLSEMGLIQSQY